jgi:hypothetical protein
VVSREELRGLGRWQEQAGKRVHRGGVNGGPAGRCARVGRGELPFIGAGEAEGVLGRRLDGRAEELRRDTRRPRHTGLRRQ